MFTGTVNGNKALVFKDGLLVAAVPENVNDILVGIKIVPKGFDETIEKANQLKSLLQEVKELAASLDAKITLD